MSETVQIIVQGTDKASPAFSIVVKSLSGVSKAADGAHGVLGKLGGVFGGLVSGLGSLGLAGMGVEAMFRTASAAVSGLISDAMEAQNVLAATNAVLASTKGVAGMTAESVGALADSLSRMIPVDDEAIQGAENLLLSFTHIGKDVFPTATESILDVSQALGQDLKASTLAIGKALDSPLEGMTALQRVGVRLGDSEEALIKQFMATNNVAGAQGVILDMLKNKFGGAAKAAGKTFAGQLTILKTQLGNVKETIGNALLPVLSRMVTQAMPLVDAFGRWLPGALATASKWIDVIALKLAPVGALFAAVMPHVQRFIDALGKGDFGAAVNAISSGVQLIIDKAEVELPKLGKAFIDWVTPMIPKMLEELGKLPGKLAQWIRDNAPRVIGWAGAFVAWAVELYKAVEPPLLEFAGKIWQWIKDQAALLPGKMIEWSSAFVRWAVGLFEQARPELERFRDDVERWAKGNPPTLEVGVKGPEVPKSLVQRLGGTATLENTFAGLLRLDAQIMTWLADRGPTYGRIAAGILPAIADYMAGELGRAEAVAKSPLERLANSWAGQLLSGFVNAVSKWAVEEMAAPAARLAVGFVTGFVDKIREDLGLAPVDWDATFASWKVDIAAALAGITGPTLPIFQDIVTQAGIAWAQIKTSMDSFKQHLDDTWWEISTTARITWDVIKLDIANAWLSIQTTADTAWASFALGWSGFWAARLATLVGFVDGLKGEINKAIAYINALITGWNALELVLGAFDTVIPLLGRVTFEGIKVETPDIPTIPLLAKGGTVQRAGSVLVGERGPEILSLPRGAQVTPLPHIPTIPLLAKGGTIRQTGSVLVGERGPEMLSLPRGAQVAPLPRIDMTSILAGLQKAVSDITISRVPVTAVSAGRDTRQVSLTRETIMRETQTTRSQGGGTIDYDRLAAVLSAQPIVVQIDGERVATVVRSRLQLRGAGGLGY